MRKSTTPSLSRTIWPRWVSRQLPTLPIVQTFLPVTFSYSLSSEAVVLRQLRRWKRQWRRSLTRLHKRTSMGPFRRFWNGTTSALQTEDPFLFWQYWHDRLALGFHWTDSEQGILCWDFKGVQEEIPSKEASTLEIGSVAFPTGQCTSLKLHPCHRLFEQNEHHDSSPASL